VDVEVSKRIAHEPRFLLVGPYDPHCGEYTFLAPPLGVWRLAGTLQARGIHAQVFDPNCCGSDVERAFEAVLRAQAWDVIGLSTTAMTLRYDLALAHLAHEVIPGATIVAGGMEATFKPERVFELGPFDLIVLGEGEHPLLEVARRLQSGRDLAGISGTALRTEAGGIARFHQMAMTQPELTAAIQATPYEQMPYERYWERLENVYEVGDLPYKAEREARLAEIRSVRLITLNYCPMGCSFCSSTNFLHEAQGGIARIARLEVADCMDMLRRIVALHPEVRTVYFQDDIFVFTKDQRILPLCQEIVAAKERGELPPDLGFISTNRIDSMSTERLTAMRRAGFRVLGFGIENFSAAVLKEFNKRQIHRHIEPVLETTLRLGITPFLDLILTSPRSTLSDFEQNVRQARRWMEAGCEVGIYPYVIPFTGSALAADAELAAHTVYETRTVPGTTLTWSDATKILPADSQARDAILIIEERFEAACRSLAQSVPHIPSRMRSVLWLKVAQEYLNSHPIAARRDRPKAFTARLAVPAFGVAE
jgi:anaerobic magnesium-protoporphyrin IX monomethyl ester cyclase